MNYNPGDILRNRYQIIEQLGKGVWGVIYLAKDLELLSQPYCAIKQITPFRYLTECQNKKLFDREVDVLYRLGKHPQIPNYCGHFKQNNKFYLVIDINPQLEAIINKKLLLAGILGFFAGFFLNKLITLFF